MHPSLFEPGAKIRKLSKQQFKDMVSASVLSDPVVASLEDENKFAIFARAPAWDADAWCVLATGSNAVARCASIDTAHEWMRNLGFRSFAISAKHWDLADINDPHVTAMASRRRHKELKKLEKFEYLSIDMAVRAGVNKNAVAHELRNQLLPAIDGSEDKFWEEIDEWLEVELWLEGKSSNRHALSVVTDLAIKANCIPADRFELALILRGQLYKVSGEITDAEVKELMSKEFWEQSLISLTQSDTEQVIKDARILRNGGYQ